MQNSNVIRSGSALRNSFVPPGPSSSLTITFRNNANNIPGTPTRALASGLGRENTLGLDEEDENAPPDPSKGLEDEIPQGRMIGAFSKLSTLTATPAQSPVRQLQPLMGSRSGSVLAQSMPATPTGGALPRNRIVFRADPSMISTFDKKVDGELYDLWTA